MVLAVIPNVPLLSLTNTYIGINRIYFSSDGKFCPSGAHPKKGASIGEEALPVEMKKDKFLTEMFLSKEMNLPCYRLNNKEIILSVRIYGYKNFLSAYKG